jgi:hypothetical protein
MTKNDILAAIQKILSDLYDEKAKIRLVIEQANLQNSDLINFDQAPGLVWKDVLHEADKQNCVFDIVVIALNQYSAKREDLTRAYKAYEKFKQPSGQPEN